MKKIYKTPSILMVNVDAENFICGSPEGPSANWGSEEGSFPNEGHDKDETIEDSNSDIDGQAKSTSFIWDEW